MSEMKDVVHIYFDNKYILIDGISYFFDDLSLSLIANKLPQDVNFDGVNSMGWSDNMGLPEKGYISLADGTPYNFGEDKYNDYIQPYVDLWQAKYDAEQEEQEQQQQEYNKFENRQARALVQLNQDFETAAQRAHVKSSLGFEVDANSTANENVNGLLITIADNETVQFCDYYNQFHELNKSQLETLQSEIVQNGQSLYAQKWQYRTAIGNCGNNEQLGAVLETIEFTYMDFTPQEDQGESQTE